MLLLLASCSSDDGPDLIAAAADPPRPSADADGSVLVVTPTSEARPVLSVATPDAAAADPGTAAPDPSADPAATGVAAGGSPTSSTTQPATDPPAPSSSTGRPSGAGVPLVIYDTDMGPDIDDALALAMLHAYQKAGRIELAAVTVSRSSVTGARFADAVNTFYGRPDIPIGINRRLAIDFDDELTYVSLADRWPNDVAATNIAEGYQVQRRVLAEAAATGRSVTIIQTGFSGNLSRLVDSPGDDISAKSGIDLIRSTVSVLSVMAGSIDNNMVEFNVEKDVASARNLIAKWPVDLVLSPFELGNAIHYPYSSISRDLGWVGRHPIKEAYEHRDLGWHVDAPPYYNMRTWDLTSVVHGVEPGAGYFSTSGSGTVLMDKTGRTTFRSGAGRHKVLNDGARISNDKRQRIVGRMIDLVSEPR